MATIAPLVEEVAGHEGLWAQILNILSVFESQPGVGGLDESHGVARSASTLVSVWVGEIVALNVSKVMVFWDFLIWDVLGVGVFLLPLLSVLEGHFEFLVTSSTEFLFLPIDASFPSDVSLNSKLK